MPNKIIFFHEGKSYIFEYGTEAYNQIINLNNKRSIYELGPTKSVMLVDDLKQNADLLEYAYTNYEPVYFELVRSEDIGVKTNCISVGYDSKIFKQYVYTGIAAADELLVYLYFIL